ncbi:mitochondrial import inner membrane translocase subunit tim21 [Myotisia sp. PD_48]|nr:mitochondrial import inner membrane translocase subunit tim21 [Myotisia sp. PD_48]
MNFPPKPHALGSVLSTIRFNTWCRPGGLQSNQCSYYATQTGLGRSSVTAPRKPITVTTDDGRIKWGELSQREKAARATQQSANFVIILVGAVMTGYVFTFLYKDVFAPDSKTNQFNRAVRLVKDDDRCIELLGDKNKIRAYGEASWNKWTRNRPVATTIETDNSGNEHMRMHFNVSGPLNDGIVRMHLVKPAGEQEFEYRLLALDVQGHRRLSLVDVEQAKNESRKAGSTLFGIRWR